MAKRTAKRTDLKMHAAARRDEMPVYAGRGGGFHKNKKAYDRARDRKHAVRAAW